MFYSPFHLQLLLFTLPAVALAFLAQIWVQSAYAAARQVAAGMSGYMAARRILDAAGLHSVEIEEVAGHLSDHYDPRDKMLRLSSEVYHGRSMAAVGIAAHEAGHALQDADRYAPLVIRNAAVPIANFGSPIGMLLIMIGLGMGTQMMGLTLIGIALFSGAVFFQLVNLPVEFNASSRAKTLLIQYGIVPALEMSYVNRVLNAAALTYVAATLHSVLQLLYFVLQFTGRSQNDDR